MDKHEKYLGDGVYASFDGYQIWLTKNYTSSSGVALEPEVIAALITYAAELNTSFERIIFTIKGN